MDNLGDILRRKDFDQPQEITIIKRYVKEHFDATVQVSTSAKIITISAHSAPLISQLRMHSPQLQKACQTDKRLVFRIR